MIDFNPDTLREFWVVDDNALDIRSRNELKECCDLSEEFADAWQEDLDYWKSAARHRGHNFNKLKSDRDRLREALREIACSGPESRCHFLANQALAATDVQEAKPDE